MICRNTLDLTDAQSLIKLAISRAMEIGSPSNIAVVDSAGFLISHVRMDGAQLPSIEHSINKAYTSALFNKATDELKQDAEPGGELYGLNTTLDGRVIVFAGGTPLFYQEKVVGAIGVSGGTSEQDKNISQYVSSQFKFI